MNSAFHVSGEHLEPCYSGPLPSSSVSPPFLEKGTDVCAASSDATRFPVVGSGSPTVFVVYLTWQGAEVGHDAGHFEGIVLMNFNVQHAS